MSNKQHKKIRQMVRRQIGADYCTIYNSMCDRPLKQRINTAYRILFKKKIAS